MTETFEKKGLDYLYEPGMTYQRLRELIPDATGVVVATQIPIDKAMIDLASNLKWIARVGSGMEHIDVTYASQKHVTCYSSPEGNSVAVAEHALGLLLNLLRNISVASAEIRNHIWHREENRGTELTGKKTAIIGFGNTGSAFAKLLRAFDADILVYDKYKTGFGEGKLTESNLQEIASEADIISFHLPLNQETFHFADDSFFSGLRKKPVLLNTSRGKIVDTRALLKALEFGIISGAALDVLENEQLETYDAAGTEQLKQLNSKKNVILTPHIAGYTREAPYKMCRILLEKLGFLQD